VMNNSRDVVLEFRVVKDQELQLTNVYNYPNPFTTRTTFMFEHNRPSDLLQVSIRIFSVAGQLVKNIRKAINSTGNRSFEIEWDGADEYGRKVARGVYLYRIEVVDSEGRKKTSLQKLVVL
jgi:flagellar hook assembly protein FlgD